jgi:tripartite-type tricarboxylate transporter receptor subunit TctC
MRQALRRAVTAGIGAMMAVSIHAVDAQTFPTKPIRLVVQYAPGGSADVVGRLVAQKISQTLGQSVIVENRAGANGMIGNEYVAKADPDGYTLLLGAAGALAIAPNLTTKEKFNPLTALAPVALVTTSSFVLTVPPQIPASNLQELTALLKANPGKYNFGSSGIGGSPHLTGELYKNVAGVQITHVPYTGLGPAIVGLLGGQIQLLFADVGLVTPSIKAGKLRAIAVTGERRSPALPNVPTMIESGLPGFVAGSWYGVFAPAGTPAKVIDRLNAAIREACDQADVRRQFAVQGLDPVLIKTPQEFAALLKNDFNRWSKVIHEAHITVE